jgi:hypothetical protein
MHIAVLFIALTIATAGVAAAQTPDPPQTGNQPPSQNAVTCPPDVKGEPPTIGSGNSKPLSDKLAESKGVICPPSGLDQQMQVRPPAGGELKVIPPPGAPGGRQDVHPK